MRITPEPSDARLVGRHEELELLRQIRAAPRPTSAVITGPLGIGKSALGREACTQAAAEGWVTLAIRGSQGLGGVPLGPFRTALGIASTGGTADMAASVERELLRLRDGKGLYVLIDDCQDLDETSAGLLHQLVAAGSIVAIVTVRSGARMPDVFTSLWKDGLAERIELQTLSRLEADEILTSCLGGVVQDSSAARIWQLTEGNPLYLREIVLSSLETGDLSLVDAQWQWRGENVLGSRVQEIVMARIGRLDPDASSAMELVALARTLPLDILTQLTATRAAEELDAHALVTIEQNGGRLEVAVAHPLHGEILRSSMPALRRRALYRNLVDALTATGVREHSDRIRLACWSLEAGLPVDRMTLSLGTDAALFGIGQAVAARLDEIFPRASGQGPLPEKAPVRQDYEVAIRLAEAAYHDGGGVTEGVALARALAWSGAFERAEDLLSEVARKAEASDDRVRLALALSWVRFWGQGDVENAFTCLRDVLDAEGESCDPSLKAQIHEQLASLALNTTHPATALDHAYAAAAAEDVELHQSIASPVAAAALAFLGRCGDAVALVDESLPAAQENGHSLAAAWLLFAKAGALARAGKLAQGRELAEWVRNVGLANDLLDAAAAFGVLAGEILLSEGRPASASRIFRDSSGLLAERDVLGLRRWALWGMARARTMVGDERSATAALDEAQRIESVASPFGAFGHLAEIGCDYLAGRTVRAVAVAQRAAAWAGTTGMIFEEAQIVSSWFAMAPSAELADRLADLAGRTDSELVGALAARAQAQVADDPEGLLAASEQLVEMGAGWLAAEAAASAALAFERQHKNRAATAAATTAARLADRCEGATSALLASLGDRVQLTKREREVAGLAALGHSSKEIAERMCVSPRTVENHLHRVYVKLGVTDRKSLADAIGQRRN